MKFLCLPLCLPLCLLSTLTALPQEVLMLGNSYTAGTDDDLQGFFNSAPEGCRLTLKSITPGGQTLYGHFNTASTRNDIDNGAYEHVVIQEQSQHHSYARYLLSVNPGVTDEENFFQKYGETWIPPETANESDIDARVYWGTMQLLEFIATSGSAGARVHVYQTWARHPDAADSALGWLPGTAEEKSQRHLEHNILMARDMLHLDPDARISRIGEAWALSLATDPSIRLHAGDGSHGSAAGYFLAAAILYQEITGLPSDENPYQGGLSAATAEFLKGVAESFYEGPSLLITDFQRAGNGGINIHWTCRSCTEYLIESSGDLRTWTEVPGTRGTTARGTTSASATFSGNGLPGPYFRVAREAE